MCCPSAIQEVHEQQRLDLDNSSKDERRNLIRTIEQQQAWLADSRQLIGALLTIDTNHLAIEVAMYRNL